MSKTILFYSLYPAVVAVFYGMLLSRLRRINVGKYVFRLIANFLLINLAQACVYAVIVYSFKLSTYLADMYLIGVCFLFTHLLQTAFSLSWASRQSWLDYLYLLPLCLTCLHLFGLMVDSYRFEGDVILHNDGPLAWVFDGFVVVSSLVVVLVLVRNCWRIGFGNPLFLNNLIAVISLIPFILIAVILIILSNTQYVISVAVIVPSVSLYVLLVLFMVGRLANL